jgi:hypothetical protein
MKTEPLFLPMLLIAVAIFIEVVTRTVALTDNGRELQAFYDSQTPQYTISLNLQRQLEGIASETAKLADGGNANAIAVVERLRQAGVTINPDPKAAPRK